MLSATVLELYTPVQADIKHVSSGYIKIFIALFNRIILNYYTVLRPVKPYFIKTFND